MNPVCAAVLLALLCTGHALAKSLAETKQICKKCDDGSEKACEEVKWMDVEAGVNVCDPERDDHASKGEYNEKLFEGDMVLPAGRVAIKQKTARWPYGVVPYEIATGGYYTNTQISTIKAGMADIEQKTCIRFKQRTDEKDYIKINPHRPGCFSNVGRSIWFQPQTVNLHANCLHNIGTTAHELLHALGFHHEQNRPDRDDYVWIDFANTNWDSQFKKQTTDTVTTSNTNYDYGSVMHYGPKGFAIDMNKPVITPLQQGVEIGQRKGLSTLDAYEANTVYNQCRDGEPGTTTTRCADTDDGCAEWAAAGYCANWYDDYMERNCKKTCNLC